MTKIKEAAKTLPQPVQLQQEPLEVSGLQLPSSDLEQLLREQLCSARDSSHLKLKHLQDIVREGKGINPVTWAISEVARRCQQLGLRPPKETVTKENLPDLLASPPSLSLDAKGRD